MGGAIKIGVTLDATIDRTKFGLEWNAPLPSGDMALGNNVELAVELEFSKSEE
jgi:polyisoprenoid-binding protein YceI